MTITNAIRIAECTAFLTNNIASAETAARGPRIQNMTASGLAV
jgi:hypothetical protein